MTQFILQYRKPVFFLGLLTVIGILDNWDYSGVFSRWAILGLPLTLLAVYGCYATIFWFFIPTWRIGKSGFLKLIYFILFLIVWSAILYSISYYTISFKEYQIYLTDWTKKWQSPNKTYTVIDKQRHLITGSLFAALVMIGYCWFLAYWHRQKHLMKRWNQWRKQQYLSTSGLHILFLALGWIFWLFFTLSPTLISGKPIAWSTTLLMMLPSVLFFYINLRTSFKLLSNNRILLALLVTLCLWGALLFVKGVWFIILTKGIGFPAILDGENVFSVITTVPKQNAAYILGRSMGAIFKSFAFKELIILLASFIYGYDRRVAQYRTELSILAEFRQQEQLKQKALEKEVVDAQLQSLKYQINPHFLFNSLNFLYSQALPLSDELARATMLLSKMMRYGLQENGEEAKVSLAGEVEHLHNFIEFNQLRFSNQLQVDFKMEGQIFIRRIMPLLLITFVENAFKYGELHQQENPLLIHLSVDSEKLVFFVRNKKRNGPKEDSTGIGLENIQRRLNLGYPDRHSLSILDKQDFYSSELTIIL